MTTTFCVKSHNMILVIDRNNYTLRYTLCLFGNVIQETIFFVVNSQLNLLIIR